jgi:Tol biopolymer transport system component
MEDTKAKEFFEGVLAKTRAGRIRWQPTAEDSEYIAAIGGQFTLSVRQYFDQNKYGYQKVKYALILKDQEGRELTKVTDDVDGVALADICELYETVRRQALRVDEKIDRVLGELSKL